MVRALLREADAHAPGGTLAVGAEKALGEVMQKLAGKLREDPINRLSTLPRVWGCSPV